MRRYLGTLVLCAVLVSPVLIAGCAARVYDYEGHDYHRWDGQERGYYYEWENDTHRRHRDYDRRDEDEQRQYWQWRDQRHGDRHRDRDRRHRDRDDRDHDQGS